MLRRLFLLCSIFEKQDGPESYQTHGSRTCPCVSFVPFLPTYKPVTDHISRYLSEARKAKANGSTRFCMGTAWRDLHGRKSGFKRILDMVSEIRGMGMEVCTTLGMLDAEQARQLKQAGLTAYNHNLDTSREYYPKVSLIPLYGLILPFAHPLFRSSPHGRTQRGWKRSKMCGWPAFQCAVEGSSDWEKMQKIA